MKKRSLLIGLAVFISASLFAQNESFPSKIEGLWEGKDRFVFFEKRDYATTEMVIILKEYYGWYFDRAVEPVEYENVEKRKRNIATVKKSEHINISYEELCEDDTDGAWNLTLKYSKNDCSYVPISLINNKIYLNTYIRQNLEDKPVDEFTSTKDGFWNGMQNSSGFTVSKQEIPSEIKSYYIQNDKIFSIRYWLADIEYTDEKITFDVDSNPITIMKNINSLGSIYTCIKGRGRKLRNLEAPCSFDENNYTFSKNNLIMSDGEPYLIKVADKDELEEIFKMVNEHNSMKKPLPPPLFPESNVDWHWDLINELEKDNELIQSVRERQRQFGARGAETKESK